MCVCNLLCVTVAFDLWNSASKAPAREDGMPTAMPARSVVVVLASYLVHAAVSLTLACDAGRASMGDDVIASCQDWCSKDAASFHCAWCHCRGCSFCPADHAASLSPSLPLKQLPSHKGGGGRAADPGETGPSSRDGAGSKYSGSVRGSDTRTGKYNPVTTAASSSMESSSQLSVCHSDHGSAEGDETFADCKEWCRSASSRRAR